MEEKNRLEHLLATVREYAETRFEIVALNFQDKVSDMLSSAASVMLLVLLTIFVLFFSSIGAAWLISEQLNNSSIGFFIVAGFYFVVALILLLNRDKWIRLPIINSILKKININEAG